MDCWKRNELRADDSKHLASVIARGDLPGVVDYLSEKGVTVNARLLTIDNRRTLPLHVAVNVKPGRYHNDVVKYLISEGANCNIHDTTNGYVPLHYAVIQRNITATKTLLDAGASVNIETSPPYLTVTDWPEKSYPLNKAVLPQSEADALRGLVTQSHLNVTKLPNENTDRENGTSTTQIVKLLLSYGADCNLSDGYGFAPLHNAVMLNNIHLAKILLDGGADVNLPTDSFDTPLFLAIDLPMLKLLLSRNADPEVKTSEKGTLLNLSLLEERADIVRYLATDTPVLLPINNERGRTPLAEAVFRHYCHYRFFITWEPIVRVLLAAGCDPVRELFSLRTWSSWRDQMMREGDPLTIELLEAIEELASNPRSLQSLCTLRIRSLLRKNVITAVDSLPLPTKLKKSLMLSQ